MSSLLTLQEYDKVVCPHCSGELEYGLKKKGGQVVG